jgi:acyl-coenzyme A thioesterase PaaI-like protein
MLFSQVLRSLAFRDGVGVATVTDDWLQGRSLFGGVQTALAVKAMRSLVAPDLPLRVVQTTFIAPVEAGEVRLSGQVLRAGKGTTHVEVRLLGPSGTAAIVIGVFGRGRPSKATLVAEVPPVVATHDPIDFTFMPGVTPNFAQHFTTRWLSGALPFTGTTEAPRAAIEIGMHDDAPTQEGHAIALADVIVPLAFSMLTERSFGSSVTWTMEMLTDRLDALPLAGWRMHAELRAGRDGYTSQSGLLCGPGDAPVALSYQSMMVFG